MNDYHFTAHIRDLVGDQLDRPLDLARVACLERSIRDVYPDAEIHPARAADGAPVIRVERGNGRLQVGVVGVPVAGPITPLGKILLVDAEPARRERVAGCLRSAGWEVVVELVRERIEHRLATDRLDAVVVAFDPSGGSGGDLLRAITPVTSRPVIALGTNEDPTLELLALELGADDFVAAGRASAVLAAHLAAIERRAAAPRDGALSWRELLLDPDRRAVRWRDEPVDLTRTEFDLLAALMAAEGRVLDHATILERVWGDADADPRMLETGIGRLRRRLSEAGVPDPVETVRGVGYRLSGSEPTSPQADER